MPPNGNTFTGEAWVSCSHLCLWQWVWGSIEARETHLKIRNVISVKTECFLYQKAVSVCVGGCVCEWVWEAGVRWGGKCVNRKKKLISTITSTTLIIRINANICPSITQLTLPNKSLSFYIHTVSLSVFLRFISHSGMRYSRCSHFSLLDD